MSCFKNKTIYKYVFRQNRNTWKHGGIIKQLLILTNFFLENQNMLSFTVGMANIVILLCEAASLPRTEGTHTLL